MVSLGSRLKPVTIATVEYPTVRTAPHVLPAYLRRGIDKVRECDVIRVLMDTTRRMHLPINSLETTIGLVLDCQVWTRSLGGYSPSMLPADFMLRFHFLQT